MRIICHQEIDYRPHVSHVVECKRTNLFHTTQSTKRFDAKHQCQLVTPGKIADASVLAETFRA